jgi:hypothetical protein
LHNQIPTKVIFKIFGIDNLIIEKKNNSKVNILFDQTCGFGKELFLNFS